MARSPQITVYPREDVKSAVEAVASEDGRSASALVLRWILERPEVKAKLNGGKQWRMT